MLELYLGGLLGSFGRSEETLNVNPIQLHCPNCDGVSLAHLGDMPTGSARSGDKFEVTCPHCSENFSIGYNTEFNKIKDDSIVTWR